MQVVLVMFLADGERRDFPVNKPVTTIGRKPSCNFRIPVPTVSREHCRIELRNGTALVRDLGSSNGTFVNHKQVREKSLKPGDTLTIGPVNFIITIDGKPESLKPVPTDVNSHSDQAASGVATDLGVSESAIFEREESSMVGPDASVESDDELLESLAEGESAPLAAAEEREPTDEELDNMTLDDLDDEGEANADAIALDEPRPGELEGLASSALDSLREERSGEEPLDVVEAEEEFANPFAESGESNGESADDEILDESLENTEDELAVEEEAPASDLESLVQEEPEAEQPRDETDVFNATDAEQVPANQSDPSAEDDPFAALLSEPSDADHKDLSELADLLNEEEDEK